MMRKLKNWFSFINESVDDNWKIDTDDINECLKALDKKKKLVYNTSNDQEMLR